MTNFNGLPETFDWGDMKMFDGVVQGIEHPKKNDRPTEQLSIDINKGTVDNQQSANGGKMQEDATEPIVAPQYDIQDWGDIKQYDDDHDNEWFRYEEKKMAELFGEKVVAVKYTNQGKVGYFCQLCIVECNSKKTLEFHCCGMKHLKKRDTWEKDGKPKRDSPDRGKPPPPPPPKPQPKKNNKVNPPDALPIPIQPFDLPSRYDNNSNRQGYGHGRMPMSPPRMYDRVGQRYTRSPPPHMINDYRDRLPPQNFHRDDEYHRERNRGRRSRSRSPPRGSFRTSTFSGEPVVKMPPTVLDFEPLSDSPAGKLLKKLSGCSVKKEQDVELGMSVVCALTKSLREYFLEHEDPKVAEVMMEAELKLGTVKTLRAGMKMLSSMNVSSRTGTESNVGYSSEPQRSFVSTPTAYDLTPAAQEYNNTRQGPSVTYSKSFQPYQ